MSMMKVIKRRKTSFVHVRGSQSEQKKTQADDREGSRHAVGHAAQVCCSKAGELPGVCEFYCLSEHLQAQEAGKLM